MFSTRRAFMWLCAAVAATAAPPPARAFACLAEVWRPPGRAAALTALVPNPASAAAVGREYLRVAPDEADIARLCELLWPAPGVPQGALSRALAQRQRKDFADGRVVRLHGWILARTEARLWALAALQEGTRARAIA
jgi:hypothetical protein